MIELNAHAGRYGIEFTGEIGKKIQFLDVDVKVDVEIVVQGNNTKIVTSLFKKPTDNRSYLRRESYHAPHTFRAVPKSQFLRARTICSQDDDYEEAAEEILHDFLRSGYNKQELLVSKEEVSSVDREERISCYTDVKREENKTNNEQVNMHLVTNYCKETKIIKQYLHDKQEEIEQIIGKPTKITMAYKRKRNMGDQIFQRKKLAKVEHGASVTRNANKTSQRCDRKRCKLCKENVITEEKFIEIRGQKIKLDMSLDCRSDNVIYLANCKHCRKGYYVGQTWTELSTRFNKHRGDFTAKNYKKSALSEHIFTEHREHFDRRLRNFVVRIILKCDMDLLDMHEDIWVEKTKARIFGLNRKRVHN